MRAAPRRPQPSLGKNVTATVDFLEEIAVSQYALHASLHFQQISTVWRDLWGHVATQLRTGKGVELPALGSIVLQPGGVCSQQCTPVLHLTGSLRSRLENNNLAQIAFEQVAHRSRLHPSICRRVVQEALSRLGQHISSAHSLQVELPGVGWLYSEGRAEAHLQLEQQLLERLALKSPLTRPTSAQVLTINHSPRGLSRPQSAALQAHVVRQPATLSAVSQANLPMQASLDSLLRLCTGADTLRTGYVTRLVLEEGLRQQCRQPLHGLPAPALLDLMDAHAAGHSDKFVRYRTFIQGLSLLLVDHQAAAAPGEAEADLQQTAARFGQPAVHLTTEAGTAAEEAADTERLRQPEAAVPDPAQGFVPPAPQPLVPSRPPTARDHASYYLQGRQRAMSRAECDAFNHMHFARLQSAHGKSGVTPKVQQEALTEEEVALLQSTMPVQLCLQPQPDLVMSAALGSSSSKRPASPASNWHSKTATWKPELQVEKQTRARNLQQGWEQQTLDKDTGMQQYKQAAKQCRTALPDRSTCGEALSPPRHAARPSVAAWGIPASRPGTARVA